MNRYEEVMAKNFSNDVRRESIKKKKKHKEEKIEKT